MTSVLSDLDAILVPYEQGMREAREGFDTGPALGVVLDERVDARLLEGFLIAFHAKGVAMTEPVPRWIDTAGRRCEDIGLGPLGRALQAHAGHEAGHHLMMAADTRVLVDGWNRRHAPRLQADRLLAEPPSPGVRAYAALHEHVTRGDAPYAQIAIEYEIEMLSVRIGPRFVARCLRVLGPGVLEGLTFLREHVALDVGHTRFNRRVLADLLASGRERVTVLRDVGAHALAAYAGFLEDCLAWSRDVHR